MMYISSPTNERIKTLVRLYTRSAERKELGVFLVEGHKEVQMAIEAGLEVLEYYHCTKMGSPVPSVTEEKYFEISETAFRKVAYREGSDGVIAVFRTPDKQLEDVKLSALPLIIILEQVEKPGNLGAVLRIADACAADAVIVCDPRTDLYNPNVIRSSVGCVFSCPPLAASISDTLQWLKKNKIHCFTASPEAGTRYTEADLKVPMALVFGTEATGLTDRWDREGTPLAIPMLGKNDSLNVSNSVAVIAFEALRQRGKKS